MNMNFFLAFEKLGVPNDKRQTIFRYDDTNPEAESMEYIESLREDVEWLGWKPIKTTFSSDYFDELHAFAVELIKRDKAYVCHQTQAEMEASREITRSIIADPNFKGDPCSPWRNRPIEESLREFENMRKGKYPAGGAVLRMKMDMYSTNPNMWDQVAYRVKYVPHPHAGDKWCIYPTYDYTHCIIDSLEHVDYSICTLEFESRRESYFWLLEALDLYRPKVYEMSRLNIAYTVLSKRKLLKLVTSGIMSGWDDPRMPTIKGLRRRGYTPEILNTFCTEIGVTRNENIVEYDRLAAVARNILHESSPRVMAVLDPILLIISGLSEAVGKAVSNEDPIVWDVPDFPFDPSRGTHTVPMTDRIYVDRSDVRLVDSDDFFGFAPNKIVGLKYACRVRVTSIETDSNDNIIQVLVEALPLNSTDKPKSTVQWVPSHLNVPAEVRLYDHLFVTEDPPDADWEKALNPNSLIVKSNALVDSSLFKWGAIPESHFQFERLGFFVVDRQSPVVTAAISNASSTEQPKVVFNLTVLLRDSKPKVEGAPSKSRKEEQAKQLAEKMARMSIRPEDMFKPPHCNDGYTQFDEEGIPTHDASGEKLSKSLVKKLKKDWEKQKKLYESNSAEKK
eukprot:CAMPEP_0174820862 /NCGR_PEP_ID=MMETSP1107-20130205/4962_1 /TAXON_ID=36770 /ORGANISM="Paraphysomonas vestita, Strain GFlagA" /LENGTH=619 /DNA_ID=CAMNT_0016037017 /DNA_START=191 /DNA_END=2050 /DNA_ORIENTATION=+